MLQSEICPKLVPWCGIQEQSKRMCQNVRSHKEASLGSRYKVHREHLPQSTPQLQNYIN